MPIEILMPALSPTMKSGKIVEWVKKEGDKVSPGEVMFKIETDKAVMEVEATDRGRLGKIIVVSGNEAEVGALIGVLLLKNETDNDVKKIITGDNVKKANKSNNETDNQKESTIKIQEDTHEIEKKDRIFATPLARKIANLNSIDLKLIKGSGPNGRIVKDDVLKAEQKTDKDSYSSTKNSNTTVNKNEYCNFEREVGKDTMIEPDNIRKVIAERLVYSKQEIPHFYLTMDCKVGELISMKSKINDALCDKDQKITVNDMIVKAVALSLQKHPEINSSWQNNKIIQYHNIDISIAVSVENSLITPIVKNADKKTLLELSKDIRRLVDRANKKTLTLDEFQGGGFTISNMGMFGVKDFKAIINPPQSVILAIGSAEKRPIVVDDSIVVGSIMTFSLSVDHRVVDGAAAAGFAKTLKLFLENPYRIII